MPPQTLLEGQTLDEIKDGLIEACDRLTALDAFSSVDVLADKSSDVRCCLASPAGVPADGLLAIAQAIPNAADVVVTVTEKPMLSLHTGTYVQARGVCKPYAFVCAAPCRCAA